MRVFTLHSVYGRSYTVQARNDNVQLEGRQFQIQIYESRICFAQLSQRNYHFN